MAETLRGRGRRVRMVFTLLAAGLLLAGSLWGGDDHFPFGPFRMYASAVDPNAATIDTRLEATDIRGRTVPLTGDDKAIRRAETEGQAQRFRDDPELLAVAADAYARRNPDAPPLREIRVVITWHEVRDFQPTGVTREEVVARWAP